MFVEICSGLMVIGYFGCWGFECYKFIRVVVVWFSCVELGR